MSASLIKAFQYKVIGLGYCMDIYEKIIELIFFGNLTFLDIVKLKKIGKITCIISSNFFIFFVSLPFKF